MIRFIFLRHIILEMSQIYDDEQGRINDQVFNHQVAFPPPESYKHKCEVEPGCAQFNPSTFAVMQYEYVAPVTQQSMTREHTRNVELIGGPFRGMQGGDGLKYNPGGWSDAWTPSTKFSQECDKHLSEQNYNRFHCIKGVPMAWEGVGIWPGADTRMGNQLICRMNY